MRSSEELGFEVITDGEYRGGDLGRAFITQLAGIARHGEPPILSIEGPIRHDQDDEVRNFEFVKNLTADVVKVPLPAPTTLFPQPGVALPALSQRHTGHRSPHWRQSAAAMCSWTTVAYRHCAINACANRCANAVRIPTGWSGDLRG